MPFILVVLFAVALLVTVTGLLLSSRSVAPVAHNAYPVLPKERKLVEPALSPAREVWQTSETISVPTQRRRQITEAIPAAELEALRSRRTSRPVPARSSRVSGITNSLVVQRPAPRPIDIDVPAPPSGPKYQGGLLDRQGAWKIVVPALCSLFLLAMYLLSLLFPHQAVWTSVWFGNANQAPTPTAMPSTPTAYTASKDLVRLSQLDPAQYQSTDEYNTWAYSACSAAAMTEVINAYGHNYRITDILETEAKIHEITSDQGLLEESGIAHTGNQFKFKTTWGHNLSLTQIIAVANSGTPVIVSFPPDRFPGGHILVVRGGDGNYVNLADSSRLNMTQMTHDRFMQLWEGFSAIMVPA